MISPAVYQRQVDPDLDCRSTAPASARSQKNPKERSRTPCPPPSHRLSCYIVGADGRPDRQACTLRFTSRTPGSTGWSRVSVWALIVLSITLLVVEALVPDGSPAEPILRRLDRAILVIFAVEIVLRVATFQPPALKVFRRPPIRATPRARAGAPGFRLAADDAGGHPGGAGPVPGAARFARSAAAPAAAHVAGLPLPQSVRHRAAGAGRKRPPVRLRVQRAGRDDPAGRRHHLPGRGTDQPRPPDDGGRRLVGAGHRDHRRLRRHHAGDDAGSDRRRGDDGRRDVHAGPVRRHRGIEPGERDAEHPRGAVSYERLRQPRRGVRLRRELTPAPGGAEAEPEPGGDAGGVLRGPGAAAGPSSGLPLGPGRPDQGERARQGPPHPRGRGHRLRRARRRPAGRGRGHHPHRLHHPVPPEAPAQARVGTSPTAVRGGGDPRLGERRSRQEGGRRRGDRDPPDRLRR